MIKDKTLIVFNYIRKLIILNIFIENVKSIVYNRRKDLSKEVI